MIKAARQHVHGKLFQANGRSALLLLNPEPKEETAVSLTLRYAVVVMGPEDHVIPALLLDDWGRETRGLAIYDFVRDQGDQFPRAEIFGFDMDGSETQLFLRSLELYQRWPCYAYPDPNAPLAEGVLLNAVLLPSEGVARPEPIAKAPKERVKRPLRGARVHWWQVPPDMTDFDLALLEAA
jgi:hypothetical protein